MGRGYQVEADEVIFWVWDGIELSKLEDVEVLCALDEGGALRLLIAHCVEEGVL